jgi:hypothetical protein
MSHAIRFKSLTQLAKKDMLRLTFNALYRLHKGSRLAADEKGDYGILPPPRSPLASRELRYR